jgi:hypothetical protein
MKRTIMLAVVAAVLAAPTAADAHSLTVGRARAAAQAKATATAGQPVQVKSVQRLSFNPRHVHVYAAIVTWNRVNPTGCKGCEFDIETGAVSDGPTIEYCSADLRVRVRSSRSRATVTSVASQSCF